MVNPGALFGEGETEGRTSSLNRFMTHCKTAARRAVYRNSAADHLLYSVLVEQSVQMTHI